MLYIYTPADGKNTEGIGAMAQYQIHAYNLSQAIIGTRFLGRDFTNLQHYQDYGTQEEFCKECTEFFIGNIAILIFMIFTLYCPVFSL